MNHILIRKFRIYLKLTLACTLLCGATAIFAQEKNELDIRIRAVAVVPLESATIGVIGGGVNISNSVIPEVDFTYFFAKNLSAELILGATKY